jgi:hypothetical protein
MGTMRPLPHFRAQVTKNGGMETFPFHILTREVVADNHVR